MKEPFSTTTWAAPMPISDELAALGHLKLSQLEGFYEYVFGVDSVFDFDGTKRMMSEAFESYGDTLTANHLLATLRLITVDFGAGMDRVPRDSGGKVKAFAGVVSVGEYAFAVARFPHILARTTHYFDYTTLMWDMTIARGVGDDSSYAWLAYFFDNNYHERVGGHGASRWEVKTGSTINEWLLDIKGAGVDFDTALRYLDLGVHNVHTIAESMRHGVDDSLVASFRQGSAT